MPKMTPELALTRARRGIQFLNRRRPGWRKHVKPTRLDMGMGGYQDRRRGSCGCILAQVDAATSAGVGFYARGAGALGITPHGRHAVALGFRASNSSRDQYALLTAAWRQALREEASRQ